MGGVMRGEESQKPNSTLAKPLEKVRTSTLLLIYGLIHKEGFISELA